MPTGVALRDPRRRLLEAAERVLLRDGPAALTSRAVTDEAGCAKGVLHRHFDDFDAFLVELVTDRLRRLAAQDEALLATAGTGRVVDHVVAALVELFDPVAVAVVALVISRDELRARLRATVAPRGIPVMSEASAMLARYLAAERDRGRLTDRADVEALAPTLVGAGHLLFADRHGPAPDEAAARQVVTTVLAGSVR